MYVAEFLITNKNSNVKNGVWAWVHTDETYEKAFALGLESAREELDEDEEIKNILVFKLEKGEEHDLDGFNLNRL